MVECVHASGCDDTCTNTPGSYSCSCAGTGYQGSHCQTDINECANSPCANNGTCYNGQNRYTCECADGFEGDDCRTDIDECAVSPCLHGVRRLSILRNGETASAA